MARHGALSVTDAVHLQNRLDQTTHDSLMLAWLSRARVTASAVGDTPTLLPCRSVRRLTFNLTVH
jgi:hypothetical protein